MSFPPARVVFTETRDPTRDMPQLLPVLHRQHPRATDALRRDELPNAVPV